MLSASVLFMFKRSMKYSVGSTFSIHRQNRYNSSIVVTSVHLSAMMLKAHNIMIEGGTSARSFKP